MILVLESFDMMYFYDVTYVSTFILVSLSFKFMCLYRHVQVMRKQPFIFLKRYNFVKNLAKC